MDIKSYNQFMNEGKFVELAKNDKTDMVWEADENIGGLRIMNSTQLGIKTVYRSDDPDEYFKGKSVWGTGRYYSLSKKDVVNISKDGAYKEYLVKSMKLAVADMSSHLPIPVKIPKRPDGWNVWDDFENINNMLKKGDLSKVLKGVDGLVIYTASRPYGYSQLVVFPKSQTKVIEKQ